MDSVLDLVLIGVFLHLISCLEYMYVMNRRSRNITSGHLHLAWYFSLYFICCLYIFILSIIIFLPYWLNQWTNSYINSSTVRRATLLNAHQFSVNLFLKRHVCFLSRLNPTVSKFVQNLPISTYSEYNSFSQKTY